MNILKYFYIKLVNSFLICFFFSFSIFYIFALIGNLQNNFTFDLILKSSLLDTFQIYFYIPSFIFFFTSFTLYFFLKNKNELLIIKQYLSLRKLILIISPLILFFLLIEINKKEIIDSFEEKKSQLFINNNNLNYTIILENNSSFNSYKVFKYLDKSKKKISEYLFFQTDDEEVIKGEYSNSININNNKAYTNLTTIYNSKDIKIDNNTKIIVNNFDNIFLKEKILFKNNFINGYFSLKLIFKIIASFIFYFLIFSLIFSRNTISKNINFLNNFFNFLIIYSYYITIDKINLEANQIIFEIISVIILILLFKKTMSYE